MAVTLVETNRDKVAAYIKGLFIGRLLNSWQTKRGDPDPGLEGGKQRSKQVVSPSSFSTVLFIEWPKPFSALLLL